MKKRRVKKYTPSKEENKLNKILAKIISASSRVSNEGFKAKKYVQNYGVKEDRTSISIQELLKLISILHAYEAEFADVYQTIRRKIEDEKVQKLQEEKQE